MKLIISHTVNNDIESKRLDAYVFENFDYFFSRKSAKNAIKRNEIMLNGNHCEPQQRIKHNDQIEIFEGKTKTIKPYMIDLRVIYEDDFLAIVEKPPGLVINGNRFKTFENALLSNIKPSTQKDALNFPSPVHRLDMQTGGLVITAKTSSARINISKQFEERKITKRYRAIIMGMPEASGTINCEIEGRTAVTRYQTVDIVPSIKNRYLALVDVYPETGRYHQIRKHFSYLGHPVLGDKIYGTQGNVLKSKGLFLWAVEVNFTHPNTMQNITVQTDEPEKFKKIMQREKIRAQKQNYL